MYIELYHSRQQIYYLPVELPSKSDLILNYQAKQIIFLYVKPNKDLNTSKIYE